MNINKAELNPRNFTHLFLGREDRAMLNAKGKIINQQVKRKKHELYFRAEAHLNGSTRLGFFNMLDGFVVPWAVVIFDEGGPSKDTAKDSVFLVKELNKLGFRGVRREVGMFKGENYNVWLFFDEPIDAKKVRHFLFALFEKIGLPLDLPIVPTCDSLPPGDYGHPVWLPYFNGVDKWRMPDKSIKSGSGLKMDKTIFIDNEGKGIKNNVFKIPRIPERDLDLAFNAITSNLASAYVPGQGLTIKDEAIEHVFNNCIAYQNLITEIENEGTASEDGLLQLAVFLRTLGLDDVFSYYADKVTNIPKPQFEKKYAIYQGPAFPECLTMKELGYCPPDQECFPKTAPLINQMGSWKENDAIEKEIEPSNAGWFYEGLSQGAAASSEMEETEGESSDKTMETSPAAPAVAVTVKAPAVDVKVEPMTEYINQFMNNLAEKCKTYSPEVKNMSGLNCGFDGLNEVLDGLTPGALLLLSGDPGSGKSTFAKQLFDQTVEKEKTAGLYVTYGISRESLLLKTVSRLSGVAYKSLKRGSLSDGENTKVSKINEVIKSTLGDNSFILEGDNLLTVDGISSAIDKSKARFAVVDFLQGIPVFSQSKVPEKAVLEAASLVALKQTARKHNIPILVIFNGKITEEIEYYADTILCLNPITAASVASSEKKPYLNLLNIEKNVEGISKITLQYTFFPPRMTFYGEKRIEYRPVK